MNATTQPNNNKSTINFHLTTARLSSQLSSIQSHSLHPLTHTRIVARIFNAIEHQSNWKEKLRRTRLELLAFCVLRENYVIVSSTQRDDEMKP